MVHTRIILFVAAFAMALGYAPAVQAAEVLSVDAVVRTALSNHPSLESAAWEKSAAQAGFQAARVRTSPEISIAATLLGGMDPEEAVVVSQPLEINGSREARARVASGGLMVSEAGLALTRSTVALEAKTAYWNAVLAEAAVRVDGENLAYAQQMAEAAQKQVDVGNQPAVHAMKAELEVARARQQLVESEAEAARGRAALNSAMGLAPWAPLAMPNALPRVQVAGNAQELARFAQANRPEVREATARIEEAHGSVDAARAARKPDVAVEYWQEDLTETGAIAATVSIPSLDWGSSRAEQRKARADLEARKRDLATVQHTVQLDVAVALTTVNSSEAQLVELRDNVLEQSRKLSELAVIGYTAGATGFLDVLEARRALRDVSLSYQKALAQHLKALAELEWAVGADPLSSGPAGLRVTAGPDAATVTGDALRGVAPLHSAPTRGATGPGPLVSSGSRPGASLAHAESGRDAAKVASSGRGAISTGQNGEPRSQIISSRPVKVIGP